MKDFILDCLFDTLKMFPFLFVAFLIIELIEHKLSDKTKDMIEKSGKFGPLIGGILGAFPQCGFSVLTTNLYITRIVTLGTLVAVYLSTSDEMIPVMLSNEVAVSKIIIIVLIKVIVGIIFGFIIDFIFRYHKSHSYSICEDDTCDCENSIIKSTIIHTLKTGFFIFIAMFLVSLSVLLIDEYHITQFFVNHPILSPMISSLLGLIPSCAASILITQLYVGGIIPFGTLISGLLTASGVGMLLLIRSNEDTGESFFIIFIVFLIGTIVGLFFNVLGVL